MTPSRLNSLFLMILCLWSGCDAFSSVRQGTSSSTFRQVRTTADSSRPYHMSTVEAPTREDIDRKQRRRGGNDLEARYLAAVQVIQVVARRCGVDVARLNREPENYGITGMGHVPQMT